MQSKTLSSLCQTAVLVLVSFTILWKGGKTLESTWLLFGVGAVCFLVTTLYHGSQDKQEKMSPDLHLFLLLFLLWTGGSYFFSKTQNYGLDELLRTGGLILILLWYVNHEDDVIKRKINTTLQNLLPHRTFEEAFFSLIVLTSVLLCLTGMLVYIAQPVNRFVGTFFDARFHTDYWPNACAQYLLFAWPISLLFSLRKIQLRTYSTWKQSLINYLIRFAPISLIFGCMFLTFSRGALIAFVGQITLLTFLLWKRNKMQIEHTIPLRHIVIALLIGFLIFAGMNELRSQTHTVESITAKITFQSSEGTSSINERQSFWKQALILSAQKPLFGWGPYSFRFVQPRLQQHVLATSDHPHNVFLKYSMERGIVATFFFTLFILMVFYSGITLSIKGKRMKDSTDLFKLRYPLLTISIAGVFAHNLIDYNLQFVGIALPLWIGMGMIIKNSPDILRRGKRSDWITGEHLRTITSFLTIVLFIVALREGYYLVTSSFGRHAETKKDTAVAEEWYARSEDEWFSRDLFLSQTHLYLEDDNIEDAQKKIQQYFEYNAEDARAWKLLGDIYLETSRFDMAISAYEQAFTYGSWNDLSISRGLLEALFAATYNQPTSDAAADSKRLSLHPAITKTVPMIEERVLAFVTAIEQNLHFVTLSPNPEEAIKILIMLSVLQPEKSETYSVMMSSIEQQTQKERSRLKSRPPGWLW